MVPLLALDLLELSAVELLLLVSVLLQPTKMAAQRIEKIRRDFLNIGFLTPSKFSTRPNPDHESRDWKSAGIIHEKIRIHSKLPEGSLFQTNEMILARAIYMRVPLRINCITLAELQ